MKQITAIKNALLIVLNVDLNYNFVFCSLLLFFIWRFHFSVIFIIYILFEFGSLGSQTHNPKLGD